MNKILRNQNGFTMIEIILSVALIGIISLALLSTIKFASTVLFASGHYMEANYEIQKDLENFVSGDVGNSLYTDLIEDMTLPVTWSGTTDLVDFDITGTVLGMDSSSLVQDETFYVFYTRTITKSEAK